VAATTARAPLAPSARQANAGVVVVVAAFALAAGSLALPWALAFDPLAWLVWGRDAGRLSLDTTTGPSWKPFPVLFTVVFAQVGGAGPALWLIVARAGGLLALAGAFVLGERLAGRWAGAAAALAIALSPWWLFNTALGNSEGLLAAAVLWAVIAHLAERPRAALALLTVAALLRPEAWPFLGLYGIWLWRAGDRRAVLAAAVIVPLLWFGPDAIGVGGALGASHTARGVPSPGSAKLADMPFLAVLGDTATILSWPVLAAALAALLVPGLARRLALGAAAWVAIVALMTVGGYAGNPRYLVAAAAVGAVLAGVGAVRLAGPFGAALLIAVVLVVTGGTLRSQWDELGARAASADGFDRMIARAGGRDALVRCSRIRTTIRARSLVAWRLDLPRRDLDLRPERPAVVIRARWFYGEGLEPRHQAGFKVLAASPGWVVEAACGDAPQVGT
jgi:hypothetical protein